MAVFLHTTLCFCYTAVYSASVVRVAIQWWKLACPLFDPYRVVPPTPPPSRLSPPLHYPSAASPRLLLANSGHLIKGLVGLMVVTVPHMLASTTKPDTWTSGRRQGGWLHIHINTVVDTHTHTHKKMQRYSCMVTHAHNRLWVQSGRLTQASFSTGVENVKGRGGRVIRGLLSYVSLPPYCFSNPSNLPLPLPLLLMPCQIHISRNRAESPCQQHCISPTALSCFCLSPHWDVASWHHCSQKIRYLGYLDTKGCPKQGCFVFFPSMRFLLLLLFFSCHTTAWRILTEGLHLI